MTEARKFTTPDGASMRIDRIQTVDTDPLATGSTYVFNVEPESPGAGGPTAADGFELEIGVAPIFVHLLPESARMRLAAIAESALDRVLELGVRESVRAEVSSDGAIVLHGRVIGRLLPLA
jgi:hypothetical protein